MASPVWQPRMRERELVKRIPTNRILNTYCVSISLNPFSFLFHWLAHSKIWPTRPKDRNGDHSTTVSTTISAITTYSPDQSGFINTDWRPETGMQSEGLPDKTRRSYCAEGTDAWWENSNSAVDKGENVLTLSMPTLSGNVQKWQNPFFSYNVSQIKKH